MRRRRRRRRRGIRPSGLVHEEDRDVVTDRVGVSARGADELVAAVVDPQVGSTVGAGEDLEQRGVEVHADRD